MKQRSNNQTRRTGESTPQTTDHEDYEDLRLNILEEAKVAATRSIIAMIKIQENTSKNAGNVLIRQHSTIEENTAAPNLNKMASEETQNEPSKKPIK